MSPGKFLFLLAALPWTAHNFSHAQIPPRSLTDYVNAALQNNTLLRSALEAKSAAGFAGAAIRRGYFPQLGIASHVVAAHGYDEALTNGGELGARLTAAFTVYDGGAREFEIRKGEVGAELGANAWRRTKEDVVYGVSVAYVHAVMHKRGLSVLRDDERILDRYLTLVRQRHAAGRAGETDALKTTVRLNNVRAAIGAKETDLANALLALATAAGLQADRAADVDTAVIVLSADTTFHSEHNVDLAAALLAQQSAELDAEVASAQMNPSIAIAADAGALTSLPNIRPGLPRVFGASAGLTVTLPVLTFGSLEDRFHAAQETARSISSQNAYLRSGLASEFASSRNVYRQAITQLHALEANLAYAEQNLALSRAQFLGGAGSSLDVLDAIQLLNDIRMSIEDTRASITESILRMNRLNSPGAELE